MPRANDEVAELLQEYSDLISISGGDAFKARAYEKAARSVGGYHGDVGSLEVKELGKIPNVGGSIAEKIREYLETGSIAALERLRGQIPDGVRSLMAIPTLGPKKAMKLYEELHVASPEELLDALHDQRLRGLPGFGPKTEENLLRGIHQLQRSGDRVLLGVAFDLAEEILTVLRDVKEVRRCDYAGSLRRMRETIGDIDLLVASEDAEPVMDAFTSMPYAARVLARGSTKSSILTTKGLQGDLRVLIEENDIRGDLHTHTNLTDGVAPLEEMVAAARARKLAYYAVTDHAELLYMQRMTKEKMLAQRRRLEELSHEGDMVLLHGTELNIQPDGSVDWDQGFLDDFDVCVASVHSHFNQSKDEMTSRIIGALEHPCVNILGHPTARQIGRRPPIDFDVEEVFQAAARTGTALEINSFPDRLDLNDELVAWAREQGAVFAVD